jgi:signal transduction histidine kinase
MERVKPVFNLNFFIFSMIGALIIGLISLYCLVRISDMAVEDYRYGHLLDVARAIEKSNNDKPVSKINVKGVDDPPISMHVMNRLEFKNFKIGEPQENRPKPHLWLVSQGGDVLSTNTLAPLQVAWNEIVLPKKIHAMEINDTRFGLDSKTFIMKLDTTPMTYLISRNPRTLLQQPSLIIQSTHTFATATLAVFLALSLNFFYMRRKSTEARKVMAKLGSGDLKARFEIKRFDEFGSLLLEFNRMADEIERLVMRLRETEILRSNLLQELGHDLRTPLTSLSTAFETMRDHLDHLEEGERQELFAMINTDIRYFKDLLEKLTLVATIDGPHYKASTERIDIHGLIGNEILTRQIASGESLKWNLVINHPSRPVILGDSHLITRLFRNAFDNASRYAFKMVTVNIQELKDVVEISVIDDGPGLSQESLKSYGKRRERRQRKEKNPDDFSLGLGSVIMKTIAQVHGGQIEVKNLINSTVISGACIKVTLKKY